MTSSMEPGRYRKWVVLVAVYVGSILTSSTSYMTGILYVALLDRYNDDKAKTSLVVSLNSGLLALLGPLVTIVINRFSCRVGVTVGGVLMTLAGLTSAFVDNVDWLILTYGIIGGTGNCLAVVPGSVVLSYYFTENRNVILALFLAFVGVGVFIASPMAMFFIDRFALKGAFIMIGAYNAHMCIIGVLCKPSKLEKEIQKKRRTESKTRKTKDNDKETFKIQKCYKTFTIQKLCFPLFLISTCAWNAVLSIFIVHLPSYASIHGSTGAEITIMMGLLSVTNTIGRLLGVVAVGSSKLNSLLTHALCLCLMGAIALTFPLYEAFDITKYILGVSAGFFNGVPNAMMTSIGIDIVGVEGISAAVGWEWFFCGVGFLVGPPIVGAMYESSGAYRSGFIFAGVVSALGGVLAVVADQIQRRRKVTYDNNGMEIKVKGDTTSSALLK